MKADKEMKAAWMIAHLGYLIIQTCDSGWDYTFYNEGYSLIDGGQLDAPELSIEEARNEVAAAYHIKKEFVEKCYDDVLEKAIAVEKEKYRKIGLPVY